MTDFAISVFNLENDGGYIAPRLNIGYGEIDSTARCTINCGGTRVYLVRYDTPLAADMDEQAADSHFMIDRLKAAFLFGGAGLFRSKSVGRLIFKNVEGEVTWTSQLKQSDPFFGRRFRVSSGKRAVCGPAIPFPSQGSVPDRSSPSRVRYAGPAARP